MNEIPLPHILAWTGFALLLLLSLPFAGCRRLVLLVYGVALRLALLAVLAAGALLWFRPDLLPSEANRVLDAVPGLRDLLPPPGSQLFGLAAAALVAAVLLPLAALFAAAWRVGRTPVVRAAPPRPPPSRPPSPSPRRAPPRRTDRRAAAEAMAAAGSRKPLRVADRVS